MGAIDMFLWFESWKRFYIITKFYALFYGDLQTKRNPCYKVSFFACQWTKGKSPILYVLEITIMISY